MLLTLLFVFLCLMVLLLAAKSMLKRFYLVIIVYSPKNYENNCQTLLPHTVFALTPSENIFYMNFNFGVTKYHIMFCQLSLRRHLCDSPICYYSIPQFSSSISVCRVALWVFALHCANVACNLTYISVYVAFTGLTLSSHRLHQPEYFWRDGWILLWGLAFEISLTFLTGRSEFERP